MKLDGVLGQRKARSDLSIREAATEQIEHVEKATQPVGRLLYVDRSRCEQFGGGREAGIRLGRCAQRRLRLG